MQINIQVCTFDVGNLVPLQVGSVPWWAPGYHDQAGGLWMQFIAGIEMPKLGALDSIQFGFISYPYISEMWLQWLGFQALIFFGNTEVK